MEEWNHPNQHGWLGNALSMGIEIGKSSAKMADFPAIRFKDIGEALKKIEKIPSGKLR